MRRPARRPAQWARSARLALAALCVLVLLSACEAQVEVDVDVRDDGSGLVTVGVGLDPAAAQRIPDLAEQLRTADLEAAGWLVDPPAADAQGVTWVRVSKPFADAEGANAIFAELTGAEGPFAGLRLERSDGFAGSSWTLTGDVDLSGGVEAFLDPTLAEALGGDASGGQIERAEAELGAPVETMVSMTLTADLPGAAAETIQLDLAEGGQTSVDVHGTTARRKPWVFAGAGSALLVLASLLALAAVLRTRRHVAPAEPAELVPAVPTGPPGRLEVVLLSASGVVLESVDEVGEVLIPFLWESGCSLDEATIRAKHRDATLGRLSPEHFWAAIGLEGDPAVHEEFLAYRHRVRPGVRDLVARLRDRGVAVVVVSNDVRSWGARLAALADLGPGLVGWFTSAELGARFPEVAAYAAVARRLGVDPRRCLVIADAVEALDEARSAGFGTALFEPDLHVAASSRHPTVRDLDLLDVAPRARRPAPTA